MATVKLSKRITDKIRSLNETGIFATELRLGGVARHLSQIPLESALEVLEAAPAEAQQDPTTFVISAAQALLAPPEPEEPPEPAEPEDAGEEAQDAGYTEENAWETAGEDAGFGEDSGEAVAEDNDADWQDWHEGGEPEEDELEAPELLPSVSQRILRLNKSGKPLVRSWIGCLSSSVFAE